jgi:hypothetical protein
MGQSVCELHEEANLERLEAKGGDSTNEGFLVHANALEPKIAKVRECSVCHDGRMHDLSLNVTVHGWE